ACSPFNGSFHRPSYPVIPPRALTPSFHRSAAEVESPASVNAPMVVWQIPHCAEASCGMTGC
ncbi:MAG: hypothetical protein ACKVOR_13590, partial [Flavobacteriales bacterium]